MSSEEVKPEAVASATAPTQNGTSNASPPLLPPQHPEDTNGEANDDSATARIKGRCDVCEHADGYQGHHLIKCNACGVCVHQLCVGKVVEKGNADTNWKCVACCAIGQRFVVSKPRKKTKTLIQEGRPRVCALCSCHTGTHHMHPLYTTHGPKGTHVVLPPNKKHNLPKRLAWVHTLCGMFISLNTGQLVYACDQDGDCEGDSDEEEGDDDSDGSSVSPSDSSDGESEDEALAEQTGHENDASEKDAPLIAPEKGGDAARSSSGGNESDSNESDGTDGDVILVETHHFVIAGKKNGQDTPWTRQLKDFRELKCHFCGRDDKMSTRIPIQCSAGSENEYKEFKDRHDAGVYCTQAMHVGCARWGPAGAPAPTSFRRVFYYPGQQTGETGESHDHADPVADSYCDLHAKDIKLNNPKRIAQRKQHVAASRNDRMAKRGANRGGEGRNSGTMVQRNNAPPAKRRRDVKEDDGLDESELKRLVKGRVRRDWFPDILDDVLTHVRSAMRQEQDVKEATTKCRKYWMKATEMPKHEFKKLWSEVRMAAEGTLSSEQGTSSSAKAKSDISLPRGGTDTARVPGSVQNVWSGLWMDDFCEGGEYSFDEWDESEEQDIY